MPHPSFARPWNRPSNSSLLLTECQKTGTNNKYTLLDILINKDALSEEENTYFRLISEDLKAAIEILDEREREVIRKFYGIGSPHIPMADIAEDMELKRERVRQIRDKAVRKMARQAKTKALKTLLRK